MKVIDFSKYKSYEELKEYTEAQYLALESAVVRIKDLQEKVKQLEDLLENSFAGSRIEKILKSPELALVEAQINLLCQRSMMKELTLEETKQLDIYIKNKKLLTGEPTTIEGSKGDKKELSEAQLLRLARIDQKK